MLLPYAAVVVGLYGLRQGFLAIVVYELGMLAWLLAMRGRSTRLPLGPGVVNAGVTLSLLVTGAAAGPLLHLLWPVLGLDTSWEALRAGAGLTGWRWSGFLFLFVFPNPILEELVWRGSLGEERRGPGVSDVAFSLYHVLVLGYFVAWMWALLGGVAICLAAWVWRRAARATNGIFLPILSHFATSASLGLTLYLHG